MNEERLQEAKRLADRLYQVHIFPDETTDGKPGYFVRIPEMPGCVADGDTVEEAKERLELAKVDFIYFLLEDDLPVPEPKLFNTSVILNMRDYMDQGEDRTSKPSDSSVAFLPA